MAPFALALSLSLLGLALGPLLVLLGQNRSRLSALVDGLTLGVVPPIILLRVLPHLYEEAGVAALALFLGGFAGSWLVERRRHGAAGDFAGALLLPTLSLHSFLDGAALSIAFVPQTGVAPAFLGIALVLHRLPEGLIFAAHLVPRVGARGTILRTALLAAATVAGALGGRELLSRAPDALLHDLVALGLGALLRLLLHRHDAPQAERATSPLWAGLSFLGGLGIVLAIPEPHPLLSRSTPGELSILRSLGPLFIETAPVMLGAVALKGLLSAAFSSAHDASSSAVRSALLGAPGGSLRGGAIGRAGQGPAWAAPLASACALVSLDLSGIALSLQVLGAGFTAFRVAAAMLVALALPRLAPASSARERDHGPAPPKDAPAEPAVTRWRMLPRLIDPALGREGAAYLCGLLVAAALEASVESTLLPRLGLAGLVLLTPAAALVFVPPAAFGVPLAAVLLHKGAPVGLLVALAVGLPLLRGLRSPQPGEGAPRARLALGAAGAVLAGCLAQLALASADPPLHRFAAHRHGVAEWICALLFALLLVQSVARRGPRSWFAPALPSPLEGS